MSAQFFGPADRRLFGYHHAPRTTASAAVVICAPCGPEYQYSHRALRVLAKRLADRGAHVLRFDYSGAGDSAGDTTDASMGQWVTDTIEAAGELQRASGLRRVDMIGLRVGAAVAARAAARANVRRLVLWDPVLDGSAWVGEVGEPRRLVTTNGADAPIAVEFGSTLVTDAFVTELRAVGEADYHNTASDSVLWLATTPEPPPEWAGSIASLERRHVPDVSPWSADTSIWSGQVPAHAIRTLVEWVTA